MAFRSRTSWDAGVSNVACTSKIAEARRPDKIRGARTKHPSCFDSFRYPTPDAVKMTHPIQAAGRRRPDISSHARLVELMTAPQQLTSLVSWICVQC